MAVVGFTPKDAARIGRVVRHVEQSQIGTIRTSRKRNQAGVTVLGKTTAAWAKGTFARLTLYRGKLGSEKATGKTFRAFNHMGDIPTGTMVICIDRKAIAAACP